jgi:hypothetical protein
MAMLGALEKFLHEWGDDLYPKAGQRLKGESQRKYDVENAEECGAGY